MSSTGWWFQPLWKIWKSVGMTMPNIWKNKIHVPNHQPVNKCECIRVYSGSDTFPCDVSNTHGYGSIPISTIFSGMNIHLPAILMFTRGTRFWHTATSCSFRPCETTVPCRLAEKDGQIPLHLFTGHLVTELLQKLGICPGTTGGAWGMMPLVRWRNGCLGRGKRNKKSRGNLWKSIHL